DPNIDPNVINLCIVSEGTYEICSRTTTPGMGIDAKWLLNVSWQMEGFDIHVDVSIGRHLSSLFKTLTALAGDEEDFENEESGEDDFLLNFNNEDDENVFDAQRKSNLSTQDFTVQDITDAVKSST